MKYLSRFVISIAFPFICLGAAWGEIKTLPRDIWLQWRIEWASLLEIWPDPVRSYNERKSEENLRAESRWPKEPPF